MFSFFYFSVNSIWPYLYLDCPLHFSYVHNCSALSSIRNTNDMRSFTSRLISIPLYKSFVFSSAQFSILAPLQISLLGKEGAPHPLSGRHCLYGFQALPFRRIAIREKGTISFFEGAL